MRIGRREWLGLAAAGLVATRLPGATEAMPSSLAIRSPGRDYGAALDRIRAYATAELEATGLPGMTMALADADGFAATLSLGWADLAARRPVTPDQLFEIGSISKSLSGLWLHAAAAKGRIDLAAPVAHLLPDVPVPPEPITLQQLLNHCGGLPGDAPVFPRSPGGRLWTGFTPGARFSYSNIGYDLLGLVIDRVAGRPHPQALLDDVIAPLGMAGAIAHIRTADRPRFATGYVPRQDDRAPLTRTAMAEGPWTEEDIAAGAVAAPATAMIAYLRYVLALGQGRGGALMPDAAARALLAADILAPEFGKDARYASGFATQRRDGRALLHHTGGMLMFSSSFHADAAAGVACFASVNARLGEYRPRATTAYAVAVLRAAREGKVLPSLPDPLAFRRVSEPRRFAGRWIAASGEVLEIGQSGDRLVLDADGARGRLEPIGDRSLGTDHPTRAVHLLEFEPEKGGFTRLWLGGTPFGRGTPAALPAVPSRLRPFEGTYVSHDPWAGEGPTVVIARGDRLVVEGGGEMVERPGGFWSAKEDEGGVDRLWFQAPVAGRPSRLNVDGYDLLRIS